MGTDLEQLGERIYEAAFLPEFWETVLHDLARLIDAEGTVICSFRSENARWIASPGVAALYADFFPGGWAFGNAKSQALLSIPHQGFICDAHHLSDEWMAEQAVYRDFYWPRGFGYAVATTVNVPNGDLIAVSIEKRKGAPAATGDDLRRLDALRPHLARTATLAARMEFARVQAGLSMLDTVGLPAAVLQGNGRVLAANARFTAMSPQVSIEARDQLIFQDAGAQAKLAEALARRDAAGRRSGGRSFPLRRVGSAPPAVAHVLPILRSAQDLFRSADAILIVTPLSAGTPLDTAILQGLFDLTPTEAKIAGELCGGTAIREIADRFGVGHETVRSHVKSILSKSGLNRQVDFVSLVAGVPRTTSG